MLSGLSWSFSSSSWEPPNGECADAADAAAPAAAATFWAATGACSLAVSATVEAADCTRGSSLTLRNVFLICS